MILFKIKSGAKLNFNAIISVIHTKAYFSFEFSMLIINRKTNGIINKAIFPVNEAIKIGIFKIAIKDVSILSNILKLSRKR